MLVFKSNFFRLGLDVFGRWSLWERGKELKPWGINVGLYLCINEAIKEILQLPVLEKRTGLLPNGIVSRYDVVGPVEIRFRNRRCVVDAMVLSGDSEPLLGAIPLEDMDVVIHPLRQELIVDPDHPDMAMMKIKRQTAGTYPLSF